MKQKRQKGSKLNVKVGMDKTQLEYAKRANEIGVLRYLGSKDVDMCEVSFETDDRTFEKVAGIGRNLIKNDRQKLFGYAITKAIEEVIAEEAKAKKGNKCSRD